MKALQELLAVSLLSLTALGGCSKEGGSASIPEAAKQEAQQLFTTRCSTCHGARGAGDGPASAGLTPKPRNFQDKGWQSSITDGQIEKVILEGGMAMGKSPAMPPNPDLNEKKDVVRALRAQIRGLAN
jgi:cytochrome c oxidase cbb3-type subunit 2/cytochrome c oxidase cbb3-type subunit I/II